MIAASSEHSYAAKAYQINRGGKGAAIGPIYEGFKQTARIYGYYKDIQPYLPETHLKKYKYKPGKRFVGAFQKTKGFLKTRKKYHQKFCQFQRKHGSDASKSNYLHSRC